MVTRTAPKYKYHSILFLKNHMPSVRKAFDAFLARYPYCYGYWKKYADLERKRASDFHKAQEVGSR